MGYKQKGFSKHATKSAYKLVDDKKTQDFIGSGVQDILNEGGPDANKKAQDFVMENTDGTTRYDFKKNRFGEHEITAHPRQRVTEEDLDNAVMLNPDKSESDVRDRASRKGNIVSGLDVEPEQIATTYKGDSDAIIETEIDGEKRRGYHEGNKPRRVGKYRY